MKRVLGVLLAAALCITSASAVTGQPDVTGVGAAILMEKETGTVLYEHSADTPFEPASVTKVMTLLLVFEALDSGLLTLEDTITASANAASMGGSQIWLKEGEQLTVDEMLKAVAVASANDCAVALAERLAGSEEAFVERMNQRAAELGMVNTTFLNCTGLPAEGHVTTARDIAIMSRELVLHHSAVQEYTTIWMDTLRQGAFQLVNTNRLIPTYPGATGLKTGSTDSALYCLSATARRDDMELIAVVLHGETSAVRFAAASSLLDFGFANYALQEVPIGEAIPPVRVSLGEELAVQPLPSQTPRVLTEKGQADGLTTQISLAQEVPAPVAEGQELGTLTVLRDGQAVLEVPLVASAGVERLSAGGMIARLLRLLCMGSLQ